MQVHNRPLENQTQPAALDWPLRLFNKSVLKQRKFKEIDALLGPVDGLHCLDIGSDNGVISYLLRQKGGTWKSADLDEHTVQAIRSLVGSGVYRIDGQTPGGAAPTPFATDEFDRVVIVDFLEHIPDDAGFIRELQRILKPGGRLILNVPHAKNSLLRRLRLALGQSDEKHGHLRPGYTPAGLRDLLGEGFTMTHQHTYSKFFSELIDTLIVFAVALLSRLSQRKQPASQKGLVVTGADLNANRGAFRLYALIYPLVLFFARLDSLLFFRSGYMLIASARRVAPDPHRSQGVSNE